MKASNNIATTTNRNLYWQNVRGICIIAVILIHCTTGLSYIESGLTSFNSIYYIIMRNIINFPVPIFIFLSGFFTNIDLAKNDVKSYYKKKLLRLFVPFVIWTTFYNAYWMVTNILKNEPINVIAMIKAYFFGTSHLYFIVLLLWLILVTPIIVKCLNSKLKSSIVFSITTVFLIVSYIMQLGLQKKIPHLEISFIYIGFYYLGMYCKDKKIDFKKYFNKNTSIIFLIFAFVINLSETIILLKIKADIGFAFDQMTIGGFLYGFSIIVYLLVNQKDKSKSSLLTYIGDNSFGIYFVHIFWLAVITNIYKFLNISFPFIFINQIIELIIALSFSMLSIIIVNKIFGKKISSRIFGF
ncbi:MAG: acyltransferase [Oscillospiraceae bacterium]